MTQIHILLLNLVDIVRRNPLLQFVVCYPITKRIGLSTNMPETVFQIYGGLRGAVGISLAIALDNEVFQVTAGDDTTKYEVWTSQVYQMVGGVAFLTLVGFPSLDAGFVGGTCYLFIV